MGNRTLQRPVRHDAGEPPPPLGAAAEASRSVRRAGLTAGAALLLMSALAGLGNFIAIEGLVTQGDAARSATDIMASEGTFRLGIASWLLIVALDVVIAWALFRVFAPVSASLSRLAAWLRLVYAGVLLVAVSELVSALRLLGSDAYLGVFTEGQLQAQALLSIETFTDIWDAGLLLFGFHLLVVAYLAYRSGYVPKLLGVLLGVAGLGYLFDTLAAVLLSQGLSVRVGAFTFIGEFLLAIWLVIWGRRITVSELHVHNDPIGVAQ